MFEIPHTDYGTPEQPSPEEHVIDLQKSQLTPLWILKATQDVQAIAESKPVEIVMSDVEKGTNAVADTTKLVTFIRGKELELFEEAA